VDIEFFSPIFSKGLTMTLQRRLLIGIFIFTLFSLAACNRSAEEPTTTPTKTLTPVGETSQAPTDTPVPPTATATSEPATPTPQPPETATPTAEEEQPATLPQVTEQPAESGFLPATMESPDFGTQAFLWWRPEVAERDLNLIREGGFHWVKQTFAWENIEGAGKGHLDWSFSDRVVQQVNESNLKLLARISTDPQKRDFWAGLPPDSADHFADYVFALASRYSCKPEAVGCIQAYQVWNEPNLSREWGHKRPNPAEYVYFLGRAYEAIKQANPNALVISAGMAPTGDNNELAMPDDLFYEQMYEAMGGSSDGYFDALGVHGVGFAAPPELDPDDAAAESRYGGHRFFSFRHVEDIRTIMERHGDDDKQIVLLEFGWTSDPVNPDYRWHGKDAGIDQTVQGEYLRRAYEWAEANWRPWIGLMSLITMPNLGWLSDGNPEDEEQFWWGIMEPSPCCGAPTFRPAYIELCRFLNAKDGQLCIHAPEGQAQQE
jgi:hypothetical protein